MKFPAWKHIHLIKQNIIVKRAQNLNTDTTKLLNQKSNKWQAKKKSKQSNGQIVTNKK